MCASVRIGHFVFLALTIQRCASSDRSDSRQLCCAASDHSDSRQHDANTIYQIPSIKYHLDYLKYHLSYAIFQIPLISYIIYHILSDTTYLIDHLSYTIRYHLSDTLISYIIYHILLYRLSDIIYQIYYTIYQLPSIRYHLSVSIYQILYMPTGSSLDVHAQMSLGVSNRNLLTLPRDIDHIMQSRL